MQAERQEKLASQAKLRQMEEELRSVRHEKGEATADVQSLGAQAAAPDGAEWRAAGQVPAVDGPAGALPAEQPAVGGVGAHMPHHPAE